MAEQKTNYLYARRTPGRRPASGTLVIEAAKTQAIEVPSFLLFTTAPVFRCRLPAACAWWKWRRDAEAADGVHSGRHRKASVVKTDTPRRSTAPART